MTRRFSFILLLLACFVAGIMMAGRLRDPFAADAQTPQGSAASRIANASPVSNGTTLVDFTRIAERTIPAVVNVSAQQVVRRRVLDPFSGFFGSPDDLFGTRRGVENSLGSGVIV